MAYYSSNPLLDFFEAVANQVDNVQQQHEGQRQADEDDDFDQPDLTAFPFQQRSANAAPQFRNMNPYAALYNPAPRTPSQPRPAPQTRPAPPVKRPAPPPKVARPPPPPKPARQSSTVLVPDISDPNAFVPPIDIYATPTEYKIYASVPGAHKLSTEVHYNPDTRQLSIEGKVEEPTFSAVSKTGNVKDGSVLLVNERHTGRFARILLLPSEPKVDEEKITAKYRAGVLEVTVPKQSGAPTLRRKILVEDVPDEELVYESEATHPVVLK